MMLSPDPSASHLLAVAEAEAQRRARRTKVCIVSCKARKETMKG